MPGPATGEIHIYGPYLRDWWKGLIQPEDAGRYHAVLVSAAYTPDLDADQHYSDLTTHEVYEGDWPQGGLELEDVAVALDTSTDSVALTHNPVTAGECTFATPAARVVIVDWESGVDASTRRCAFTWSLTPPLPPVAGPVVISAPNGLTVGGYA